MKKEIPENIKPAVIKEYLEGSSTYRLAEKYSVSATSLKRFLNESGVLRTQSEAASLRNKTSMKGIVGKYQRTQEHKNKLSECAKLRTGDKNPFSGKTHSDEAKAKIGNSSKERIGKRNGNYKNGNYIRRPRDFKVHEFTSIRNSAFNRDSFTCILCEKTGGHLHAHHMLPFWVKPEAFLDIDNLITVCTECHFTKCHLNNWSAFNVDLITECLIQKYSLDRERLSVLATFELKQK